MIMDESQDELQVLESIYMENLQRIETDDDTISFKLQLLPSLSGTEENYVAVNLIVKFEPNYPNQVPQLTIERVKGIAKEEIEKTTNASAAKGGVIKRATNDL